jgi:uncharacterized protein YdbL (DUF1318 family)
MTRSRLFLALLALGLASLFALAAVTERKTVTGTISDSMCGAAGHMMTDKGDADCVRACIKDGSKYVLVADKTVYRLEGDTAQIDKFAGSKATVTGVLSGETLKVATITSAK